MENHGRTRSIQVARLAPCAFSFKKCKILGHRVARPFLCPGLVHSPLEMRRKLCVQIVCWQHSNHTFH